MRIDHTIESFYEYTAGKALSKFLLGLRSGKILGGRCGRCGQAAIPPRAYCINCYSPDMAYYEMDAPAYVATYTVSNLSLDGGRWDRPVTWVFVKYSDVAGGLLHILADGVEPYIGLRVKPVFRSDRIGSIWDIMFFTHI
ncbi:MAG: Zn-ribbon domain-containing OB-fold protein [Nitrososphaerota archaeon]